MSTEPRSQLSSSYSYGCAIRVLRYPICGARPAGLSWPFTLGQGRPVSIPRRRPRPLSHPRRRKCPPSLRNHQPDPPFVALSHPALDTDAQGPVGNLLVHLNRHNMRPNHLHLMAEAQGFNKLVTALYPDGDAYLSSDAVFGVKKSLVVVRPLPSPPNPARVLMRSFVCRPCSRKRRPRQRRARSASRKGRRTSTSTSTSCSSPRRSPRPRARSSRRSARRRPRFDQQVPRGVQASMHVRSRFGEACRKSSGRLCIFCNVILQ